MRPRATTAETPAGETSVAALAMLRDGHRVVDGVVVPPRPGDRALRVWRVHPTHVPLLAVAVLGVTPMFVPHLHIAPSIALFALLAAPLLLWARRRNSRWSTRYPAAKRALENANGVDDIARAEQDLRALATEFRGDVRGAIALLEVAACRARHGDFLGALEIYGELHASSAFASEVHHAYAMRLTTEAASASRQAGDEPAARRWGEIGKALATSRPWATAPPSSSSQIKA